MAAGLQTWTVTSIKGTVIYLVGDKWEEVTGAEALTDPTLRTLRSGYLSLSTDVVSIAMSPKTVVELNTAGSRPTIKQYAGVLQVISPDNVFSALTIQAGSIGIGEVDGTVAITVADGATTVVVSQGQVEVSGPKGDRVTVTQGQYISSIDGTLVAQTLAAQERPANPATRTSGGPFVNTNTGGGSGNASSGNAGNASSGNAGNPSSGNASGGGSGSSSGNAGGGGSGSSSGNASGGGNVSSGGNAGGGTNGTGGNVDGGMGSGGP